MRIVKAEDLRPGQRIVVAPGRVETVAEQTELDAYGGCSVHTTEHEILTQLPCNVKVVEG